MKLHSLQKTDVIHSNVYRGIAIGVHVINSSSLKYDKVFVSSKSFSQILDTA
jgi:hypothetical protein